MSFALKNKDTKGWMKYSTQNKAIPSKSNKISSVLSVLDVFNASTVLQEETNFVEDFVLFDCVIEKIDSLQENETDFEINNNNNNNNSEVKESDSSHLSQEDIDFAITNSEVKRFDLDHFSSCNTDTVNIVAGEVAKCLLLEVAEMIKDAEMKKPTTAFQSADVVAKNLIKYKVQPCFNTFCKATFCSKTFTEDHRYDINLAYWIQTFAKRQRWLDTNVFISNTNKTGDKVCNVALSYYLPTECGEKVRVCKIMFMATLGMKTDGMIPEFVKKKEKEQF